LRAERRQQGREKRVERRARRADGREKRVESKSVEAREHGA
jgi:hypothetical protein